MNTVSINSMLRFLISKKRTIIIIMAFTLIFSLLFAYIFFPSSSDLKEKKAAETEKEKATETEKANKKSATSKYKENLNAQYKKELDEHKSIEELYPQLQFDEVWRCYYKFFLSPVDPLRTDKLVNLYSGIKVEPDAVQDYFFQLTKMKLSDFQLSKLILPSLNNNTIEIKTYGPSPESSAYLAAEYIKLMKERFDNAEIEHKLIEVTSNNNVMSKEYFLQSAKKTLESLEKKKKDLLFKTTKAEPKTDTKAATKTTTEPEEEIKPISKSSHFIKYGVIGVISGILIIFLLSIFGSAGKIEYQSVKELLYQGIPIVGVYKGDEQNKIKLDSKLFAGTLIKPESEVIAKAIFTMIPALRQESTPLLFLYDNQLSIENWKKHFGEFNIEINYVPIDYNLKFFNAIRGNSPTIVLIDKDRFIDFAQETLPQLSKPTSISIVLN